MNCNCCQENPLDSGALKTQFGEEDSSADSVLTAENEP